MKTLHAHILSAIWICSGASAVQASDNNELKLVQKYSDLTAVGLTADVKYAPGKKAMLLGIHSADKTTRLPEWMQAFYFVIPGAKTARPLFEFDMAKPNRVGASVGVAPEGDENYVLIVGELLKSGETFQDKKYIAIRAKDLVEWRGPATDAAKATQK